MAYDMGFVLDGLILVFLSVTIFDAARLSLFMKSFREGREGMQLLIRDLSVTIDKAEASIQTMKGHAKETELEIREIINEAKFLSDELRFMNETGDGLAGRLEKLADRNRELVDLMENAGGIGTQKITPLEPTESVSKTKRSTQKKHSTQKTSQPVEDSFEIDDLDEDDERDFIALNDGAYVDEENHKSKIDTEAKSKVRSFAIFDREYMDEENDVEADLQEPSTKFHSRAEQDLYEALQRRKRVSETS